MYNYHIILCRISQQSLRKLMTDHKISKRITFNKICNNIYKYDHSYVENTNYK